MASVEIGTPSKSIVYLNLSKSGIEHSNDATEYCSVTMSFQDFPLVDKQSDYICAVTRFCVPLQQIPIVTQKTLRIWGALGPGALPNNAAGFAAYEAAGAGLLYLMSTVEIPAAFTTYEFLNNIRLALRDAPNPPAGQTWDERVKVTMTPDFKFQVWVSNGGYSLLAQAGGPIADNENIWVTFDDDLFKMLQFQTTAGGALANQHGGSRFIADPAATQHRIGSIDPGGNLLAGGYGSLNALGTLEFRSRMYSLHQAPMSAADSINRIKSIVFESDLAVKSERNTESGFKRFLCDYVIENPTTFSYKVTDPRITGDPYSANTPNIDWSSTVTEELPSHRIYTSSNASGGRWQMLSLPAPLYQIEVRASVKVWDYATNRYSIEPVPLPAGSQYSAKIIFVSKNSLEHFERPDAMHK